MTASQIREDEDRKKTIGGKEEDNKREMIKK